MKRPPGQSRPWKFAEGEFIVHRLGETSYPSNDEGPGISDWFKLESFDFYHNGIEGILGIEYALVSDDTGQWASLDYAQSQQTFPERFHIAKVFETGRIPGATSATMTLVVTNTTDVRTSTAFMLTTECPMRALDTTSSMNPTLTSLIFRCNGGST